MLAPIVSIVGPTAVGKTEVAVALADDFAGEVVSLDSRQMVRRLEIGTAKPSAEIRRRVRHHLVDVVDPDAPLSLADVQSMAYAAIDEVLRRQRLPILCGGSGQYVRAVLEGWQIPAVAPDPELRASLAADARQAGPQALHARLAALDPVAAQRIDCRNVRRVIRALEVRLRTGQPISALQTRSGPRYRALVVGLSLPRPMLYARADERIDAMIASGLEDEVRRLAAMGYGFELPAMTSVGYAQWRDYFAGTMEREEVIRRIRRATRRLIRQQATWFRGDDPAIHWFDRSEQPFEAIRGLVASFLCAAPNAAA